MLDWLAINASVVRHDTMEGRDYLVAPAAMITEGVHEGSDGPIMYFASDLGKSVQTCNHKPIVLWHPQKDGKAISACDPVVLTSRKVGVVLNTLYNDKLRSEAWLEKSRLKEMAPAVLEKLEKGELVELSTGFYYEPEKTAGEFGGKKYTMIARNCRLDHLALLPDQKGACSCDDGCGLLQNAAPVTNAMSFGDIANALQDALGSKYGEKGKRWYGWIQDIYPDYCIYRTPDPTSDYRDDGKLWMQKYTATADGVTLSGEPEAVERVTEYRSASGAVVGNMASSLFTPGVETMPTKIEVVDQLVKNGWQESERPWLMSLSEDRLTRMAAPPVTAPVVPAAVPVVPAPVVNVAPVAIKPATVEEYVNNAPEPYRTMLKGWEAHHTAEKQRLVTAIVANSANQFTPEFLGQQPLDVLKGMAALAQIESQQPVNNVLLPNYSGAAGGPANVPVINEEPLPLPGWEPAKKSA